MGLNDEEKKNILIAGLLHDSGTLHEQEILKAFKFDYGETVLERECWNTIMLKKYEPKVQQVHTSMISCPPPVMQRPPIEVTT